MTNREIDALIAEKVMEWRRLDGYEAIVAAGQCPPNGDTDRFHYKTVWVNSENHRMACAECGTMPEFSTDSAASKQLRDKMRADGYRFTSWDIPATESLRVRCTVVKSILDGETWQQVSDTEEMAVALAALRAVGVKIE